MANLMNLGAAVAASVIAALTACARLGTAAERIARPSHGLYYANELYGF